MAVGQCKTSKFSVDLTRGSDILYIQSIKANSNKRNEESGINLWPTCPRTGPLPEPIANGDLENKVRLTVPVTAMEGKTLGVQIFV